MQKFFLVLFVGMLGVFIGNQAMKTSTVDSDVLLANVEALANMETSLPTVCWDQGSCTCPNNGAKVAVVYEGYSLDPDAETY